MSRMSMHDLFGRDTSVVTLRTLMVVASQSHYWLETDS